MKQAHLMNRLMRIRAGRRTVLGAGVAAFVAACGSGDNDSPPAGQATSAPAAAGSAAAASGAPAAPQPKPGGTLRSPLVGVSSGDPPTIHPYENLTYLAQIPSAFHYSRLLRSVSGTDIALEDHTKLEGDAAAKLPEQPDGVTYIFSLKPNVLFHDKPPVNGRAMTARDVIADWEAFKAKSQNSASFTAVIDKVEAPDDKTVKIVLKSTFAPFLVTHVSSSEGLWLIPPETLETSQVQTDPVGSGPWIFRQWDKGVALRWDRNPKWHDGPLPYFAKVEQSVITDPQRIMAALQTGDFDLSLLNGLLYEEAKKKLDPKGYDSFWPNQVSNGFYFNFDNKPWGDKRVRQALSMALDRDGYLKVQDGTKKGNWQSHVSIAMAPYYISPRDSQEFGPNAKYFKKDIAEAKKLLAAAGYPDGFSFKLIANIDRYGAEAKQAWELFAQTLPEAGFKAELTYQEYGAYIQSTFLGKMPENTAAVGPFIGGPRDVDDILMRLYWSESPRHNWGGTPIAEMPQLDAMFVKQRKTLDLNERLKEVKEIQRVMAESMLVVPYHGSAGYAYVNPWIVNYNWKNGYGYPTESYAKAWFTDDRVKKG